MSEVIKHINEYYPNENGDFLRRAIGADAENVLYKSDNISVEQALLNLNTPGAGLTLNNNKHLQTNLRLQIKYNSNKIDTFDGTTSYLLDLSKYTTSDIDSLNTKSFDILRHCEYTSSTDRRIRKNYANTSSGVLTVPTFNDSLTQANSSGQYTIKNGWRYLASFTIPKGQTWLLIYNVAFPNYYHNSSINYTNNTYFNSQIKNADLGTYRSAMITTIGLDKNSIIEGINTYTGIRENPYLNAYTLLSKTTVLPRDSYGNISSSTDATYYLWAAQDSNYSLPVQYDILGIRLK
jgi:hypothetical protein